MTGMPAHAAGTWHIKNGGVGYHGAVKATVKAGTKTTLTDKTRGLTLICSTAVAGGSAPASTVATTPATVGHLNAASTSWKNCTLLGLTFTAKLTTNPNLVANSYNATTGVTKGHIGGTAGAIKANITGVGNGCTGTVSGTSVPLSFVNGTHQFNINAGKVATLKITAATGCPFAVGDTASFNGQYTTTTPAALTISQS